MGHSSASVELDINSSSGTFAASDAENSIAFSVSTNNLTGYNLSLAGSDDTRQLSNTDSEATLDSLASAASLSDFSTGAAATYSNKWGYLPSMYNSTANANYLKAPTTTAETLNKTQCANNTTNCPNASDSYTIGIAARADYTKPTGTYTNTFVLTAVSNYVMYQINYLDNTGDGGTTGLDVSNLPASEGSETATASSFTLSNTSPTRTGYTFNKWCLGTVTHVTSGNSTCSGTEYAAGANFTFTNPSSITTNTANLYAMWNVNTYNLVVTGDAGLSSMTIKQGSTTGTEISGTKSGNDVTFSNLAYGISYYLYPVFETNKLFDSWAKTDSATNSVLGATDVENTYYTMGDGAGAITLTSKSNAVYIKDFTKAMCQEYATNNPTSPAATVIDERDGNDYQVRYINGNCWMVQNLRYKGDTTGSTATNMAMKATTSNISADKDLTIGDLTSGIDYNNARIHDSGNTTYGVWYNYAAASAGYVTSNKNSTTESTESVCPKNWRLPTNSEQSGIANNTYKNAYFNGGSAVTGGNYSNGSVGSTGSGYWWSSTPVPSLSSLRYYLYYNGSSLTINYVGRGLGFYVRCIRST